MSNLLQNPTFGDWRHVRYFTDREGKSGTIEAPIHWDFIALPREDDPNRLPQSLHRDTGFVISAGYRAWEAGYQQSNARLQAGQRYRVRAKFKPDVNFPGGHPVDLTAITWRFTIASSETTLAQDWEVTRKGQYKQIEEYEFVFEAASSLNIDVTFWARSFYAGNDCDFWVYGIVLEPVAANYGEATVPTIGTAETPPPPPPEKQLETDNKDVTKQALNSVMVSAQEVEQITTALHAMSANTTDEAIKVGLETLAKVFDRAKQK